MENTSSQGDRISRNYTFSKNLDNILVIVLVSGVLIESGFKAINNYREKERFRERIEIIQKVIENPRYKIYRATKKVEELVKEALTYRLHF